MLFDLRGRGRRRTVQVIYATLALLMGGGLVFFGIGGNTSGGLFDAFGDNNSSTPADEIFEQRLKDLQQRTTTNARDAEAWAEQAKAYFQLATSDENRDPSTGAFTEEGRAELGRSERAWDRYLALDPQPVDATVATVMTQALGALERYDKAVRAQEIVIDAADPATYQQYFQLALLAHAAGQDRKSTLAGEKAVELAPDDIADEVESQIDQQKAEFDSQSAVEQPSDGS